MEEQTWGFRFNEQPDYQYVAKGQKPRGCPEWLNPQQVKTWQEQGLVIWTKADTRIEVLRGHEAIRLLNELVAHDNWKSTGIAITRHGYEFVVELPRRGRRQQNEPVPQPQTTKSEPVYRQILQLPPEAGPDLIQILRTNEHALSEMAEQEKRHFEEAVRQFWEHMLRWSREKEQKEFDFKTCPFEWQIVGESRWMCRSGLVEGQICLDKSEWWWHACVKRAGTVAGSIYVQNIKEAVEWVEMEMSELTSQPEAASVTSRIRTVEQINADRVRLREKLVGGPYWIDPAAMEPSQITYQLLIELDAEPVDFKTYESICGDTLRYGERYLSPSKLAQALTLDIDHFKIDQPAGENSPWYRITSLTAYHEGTRAAAQAQEVWDRSQILQQFKAGRIERARYGYEEVETGFEIYLGACEHSEDPWWPSETRNEHMELRALGELLSVALDVKDYRDYLGVSEKSVSDERLLRIMHAARSRSKHAPDSIRRESKVWLAQHDAPE